MPLLSLSAPLSDLLSSLSLLYVISPSLSLCPLYLSPIVPCLPSSFMFGVSGVTPPHRHGHAHRCADVCRVYVCVQEEQAADSWAKAKTYSLLREGDSEEEREVD